MNDQLLKVLIREWKEYLEEEVSEDLSEFNTMHKPDGTWGSKKAGNIYSVTKRAKKHLAKDSDVEIGRGTITKKGKLSAKFGMNTGSPDIQCGRLTIDGDKKPKTRSCKDYPDNYQENLLAEPDVAQEDDSIKDGSIDTGQKRKPSKRVVRVRIKRAPRIANNPVSKGRIERLQQLDNYKTSKRKELDEEDTEDDRPESKMRKLDKVFAGAADLKRLSRGIYEGKEYEVPLEALLDALVSYLKEDASRMATVLKQLNKVGLYGRQQVADKCRSMGRYSLADWTEIQNRQALAQKGELNKPPKEK